MPDHFMQQKPHPATRLSSPFYLLSVLDTRGHWERRKGTDQGVSVLRSLLLIHRHLNLAGLLSCDPGDFKTECCQKKTPNSIGLSGREVIRTDRIRRGLMDGFQFLSLRALPLGHGLTPLSSRSHTQKLAQSQANKPEKPL